ncbi:MAG: extracellular solute-binding protein [Saccharofermentans sp.]|nr:extracellular solute-binding protein [Saccharofermentans sp.]
MKTLNGKQLLSLTLAVLIAVPSISCSSKKKDYQVIKEDDTWYSCDKFYLNSFYPKEEYEYIDFETVGATDSSIFIKAEATKHFEYHKDMKEDEIFKYYDQAILEFSFDGELLNKTDYAKIISPGRYSSLCKAWITNNKLNILEQIVNVDGKSHRFSYLLNGEEFSISAKGDVYSFDKGNLEVGDIYSSSGNYLIRLAEYDTENNGGYYEELIVVRPEGIETLNLYEIVNAGYEDYGEIIPAENGKVILPVYLRSSEDVFLMIDFSGSETEIKEIESLYGTSSYELEYASGKMFARDFNGLNFVDSQTGDFTPICGYFDIDASLIDTLETSILYVSDDGSDIILGGEEYDPTSLYGWGNYKIMHLKKQAKNPHAGKTVLTLSNDKDSVNMETTDFLALYMFNNSNDSFFLKYVFPFDKNMEPVDVDADIIRSTNPPADPGISGRYINLAPYLDLADGAYKEDYFSNAIEASMAGNELYSFPLDISASGILTASANLASGQKGFTFDEYAKFVKDRCNGTDPMSYTSGYRMGKAEYFTKLFMNMSDLFIKNGKVDLKGEEFKKLIEYVEVNGRDKTGDEESGFVYEHNASVTAVMAEIDAHNAAIEGKLGAEYGELYSFDRFIGGYRNFGNGVGVYGLPSFDGRGPQTISSEFVSVSNRTAYPEACVEYIKILLSYDVQKESWTNPINKKALRTIAERQLNEYNDDNNLQMMIGHKPTANDKVPEDAIDKYIELLSSSYGGTNLGQAIEDILREESSSYFTGNKSLDDIIPVMQRRIQTVLDEAK